MTQITKVTQADIIASELQLSREVALTPMGSFLQIMVEIVLMVEHHIRKDTFLFMIKENLSIDALNAELERCKAEATLRFTGEMPGTTH